MKNLFASLFLFFCSHTIAQDAKIVSDCIVNFDVSVQDDKADQQVVKAMAGATKILYIKGARSRSDLITPGFKQTTLTNTKSDSIVILRELGSTKYITYLNGSKKAEQNKKYEGIQFTNAGSKKTILGYNCQKVVAKLSDGSAYNIFYTSSIRPSNKEFEYQFKDLPGFVLEYESESEDGKTKITYVASKITLEQVPDAKFDIPKSGYRVL